MTSTHECSWQRLHWLPPVTCLVLHSQLFWISFPFEKQKLWSSHFWPILTTTTMLPTWRSSFHSTRWQNKTFTWRLVKTYSLAMPIHLLPILRKFQSNSAMDFFSTSRPHVKLMQLIEKLLCTLIKFTCSRHGIELQANTSQSIRTRFRNHAIGLEDQLPTIKLQNWLRLVAKLALLKPSL